MPRRTLARIPAAIAFAVVGLGTAAAITAATACGDDDEPQECTIEGDCPDDGRVCIEPQNGAFCCPVCPVLGSCPSGCVLDFPPI